MKEQILIAGFGGQGVLAMGKMLAEAALAEGREVSWLPSYGPEMRGGTSNVSVNLSDQPIGSPVIGAGDASCVVAMNLPSLLKFENFVRPNGVILVNSSIIDRKVQRRGVHAAYVPANDIASELGNPKVLNMVMLGAYIARTGLVKAETMIDYVKKVFGGKKPELVELNKKAIERGAAAVLMTNL